MTRLQETERAYLVAKMEYLAERLSVTDEEDMEALNYTQAQYNACEKRLIHLDEEIAR